MNFWSMQVLWIVSNMKLNYVLNIWQFQSELKLDMKLLS